MNIRYVVGLTEEERAELKALIGAGKTLGQKRKRAQILLACDRGMTDETIDFAECMRDLVDLHYPKAERVRVVLDNLSTHLAKSLYEAFPAEEARRILRRLEFHYTPKHASWLNMVEIEISVLASQCLDRRIPDRATLEHAVAAWQKSRNATGARIRWMFSVEKARKKLGKSYPSPAPRALAHAA